MYWANFLHIYQPPTQKELWVRRIAEESYRKIVRGLRANPRAKITLNINGILCELLDRYGGKDVLADIKALLEARQIELTGSAKYHAFLPLLPTLEIERQIRLNEETLDAYFGDVWRKDGKHGFFPPEMAYSKEVATVACALGYQWIIVDELAFPTQKKIDGTKTYTITGLSDFGVFFRERTFSFAILSSEGAGSASTIIRYLSDRLGKNAYTLTAMDGETFGHHRPGLETLLFDLMREKSLIPTTISELKDKFPNQEIVEPRNSTWAATTSDLQNNTPYSRWQKKDNPIQQRQWELTEMAIRAVQKSPEAVEARKKLDEALHSDQYWWASARPWWSLEMIERGAYELKSVVETAYASEESQKRAEELYKEILYLGFEWQRSGKVDEISRQEDEEISELRELKKKFFITKEEYGHMIQVLKSQIRLAARAEEYHRAAMIKDRVRELCEEMKKTKK